jgi:hypothetical protein
MTGNAAVDAANLTSTANVNLAAAAGLTMTASAGYDSYQTVSLIDYNPGISASVDERYTDAQVTAASTDTGFIFQTGSEDEFTLTVTDAAGVTNTVTASIANPGNSVTGTTLGNIEDALLSAWANKYGASGTASTSAIATMIDSGTGNITVDMLQKDSGGLGAAVSFSVSNKTTTTTVNATQTSANIDWVIGSTLSSTDNTTVSTSTANSGLIVAFESKLDGVTDTILTGMTTTVANGSSSLASMTQLTTTYNTRTGVTTAAMTQLNRTDVRNVVAAVANTNTSNATAQTLFTRVFWLG